MLYLSIIPEIIDTKSWIFEKHVIEMEVSGVFRSAVRGKIEEKIQQKKGGGGGQWTAPCRLMEISRSSATNERRAALETQKLSLSAALLHNTRYVAISIHRIISF